MSILTSCSLVIACDVSQTTAVTLSSLVEHKNIPLIVIRSYGMLATMRLYKRETCITEAKEFAVKGKDLRVTTPWPELL